MKDQRYEKHVQYLLVNLLLERIEGGLQSEHIDLIGAGAILFR